MKACPVPPQPRLLALLPAPVFADAYRIAIVPPQLDATAVARAMFATQPA